MPEVIRGYCVRNSLLGIIKIEGHIRCLKKTVNPGRHI